MRARHGGGGEGEPPGPGPQGHVALGEELDDFQPLFDFAVQSTLQPASQRVHAYIEALVLLSFLAVEAASLASRALSPPVNLCSPQIKGGILPCYLLPVPVFSLLFRLSSEPLAPTM